MTNAVKKKLSQCSPPSIVQSFDNVLYSNKSTTNSACFSSPFSQPSPLRIDSMPNLNDKMAAAINDDTHSVMPSKVVECPSSGHQTTATKNAIDKQSFVEAMTKSTNALEGMSEQSTKRLKKAHEMVLALKTYKKIKRLRDDRKLLSMDGI